MKGYNGSLWKFNWWSIAFSLTFSFVLTTTRCLSISAVSLQNSLYRRFLGFGNGYSLLKTMEGEPMSNIPGANITNIRYIVQNKVVHGTLECLNYAL
jgi:hypothetical protein